MRSAPKQVYNEPPEILAIFDLLSPGAHSLLRGICRAWGSRATVEDLGHGRAVLVVRPGGGLELAR